MLVDLQVLAYYSRCSLNSYSASLYHFCRIFLKNCNKNKLLPFCCITAAAETYAQIFLIFHRKKNVTKITQKFPPCVKYANETILQKVTQIAQ